MSVLDAVRAAAARVAAQARFVRLVDEAIEPYALSLPLEAAHAAELDPATHYVGEPEATLAYVVTLDAINFGSGYFPHLRKPSGLSGYFTVASSLKAVWEQRGPLDAAALAALSQQDCAAIFGQDLADPATSELMGLFAQALNQLGHYLTQHCAGRPRVLVERAQRSAERLVELLAEMSFYRDVASYAGQAVLFYKRAQLTAADLSLAGVAAFDDLHRLTIFADNLVPHVLRVDGVLHYAPELLERIQREELLPSGSTEEVEIRACALHATERMAAALRARGERISPMQLDYVLWNRGQGAAYKALPRHRSRGVFY